jgi:hypothetical protein
MRTVPARPAPRAGSACGDRDDRVAHPRVLREGLPAHEREPATGPQRARDVGERSAGVGEEHHTEAREGEIDTIRCEREGLRVRVLESQVRELLGARALARACEHRRRDVDAEHGAGRTYTRRELQARLADSAADVEHALAFAWPCAVHGSETERREHCVHARVLGDPLRPACSFQYSICSAFGPVASMRAPPR